MKQVLLGNAFSLQMLDLTQVQNIKVTPIQPVDVPADAISVIGHQDMAAIVGSILGRPIAFNRVTEHIYQKEAS